MKSKISIIMYAASLGMLLMWCGLHLLNDCQHISDITFMDNGKTNDVISSEGLVEENLESPSMEPEVEKDFLIKKGYHIHINLDQLTMYVYKEGQLIKTYHISGGKSSSPSPVGTWKIISKDTWGEGFGGAWMGLNVPWGNYGIHGTMEPWYVGKSHSSKGCIRMRSKDAQELYKIVPHGTTVTIEYINKPFRLIQSGDIGSDVLEVERALQEMKYYSGSIDGRFGTGLKNSVIEFQRDNKLKVTGTINRQTYDIIMSKYKSVTDE